MIIFLKFETISKFYDTMSALVLMIYGYRLQ